MAQSDNDSLRGGCDASQSIDRAPRVSVHEGSAPDDPIYVAPAILPGSKLFLYGHEQQMIVDRLVTPKEMMLLQGWPLYPRKYRDLVVN